MYFHLFCQFYSLENKKLPMRKYQQNAWKLDNVFTIFWRKNVAFTSKNSVLDPRLKVLRRRLIFGPTPWDMQPPLKTLFLLQAAFHKDMITCKIPVSTMWLTFYVGGHIFVSLRPDILFGHCAPDGVAGRCRQGNHHIVYFVSIYQTFHFFTIL